MNTETKTPKLPKAGKHRLEQLAKLDTLAASPGTPDEGKRAADMAAAIRAKYDCAKPEQDKTDIFAGVFHREAMNTVPIAKIADIHVENAVKWAIEARTKIPCVSRDGVLCAAATNGTATKLGKIAETVSMSFLELWNEYSRANGTFATDRPLFYRALYDGMMNDDRAAGEALPARTMPAKMPKAKRKALAFVAGLNIHPYSVALELGRMIRFSVPLPDVAARLKEKIAGALPATTEPNQ